MSTIEKELKVVVDRDSVCAGDDTESHRQSFSVPASATISDFLRMIQEAHFLASIQGGQATWLIDCVSQSEERCIGVAAQQWSTPQLLVSSDTLLLHLLSGAEPQLYFRYWAQADPAIVFERVQSGYELPGRYD